MMPDIIPNRIRAFVALRLAAEVEQAVADLIESLQSANAPHHAIRWVRRANLHLTLRFLGDRVEAATLERLDRELSRIATATVSFTIGVRGTGAFPNLAQPRVIWAGLESAELVALAGRVERAAIEAGLAPESRAYSPHLTIGRVRDLGRWSEIRPAIEAAADCCFGRSPARSLTLYRSMLGVPSATYEELVCYPFGSGR
jgi:RNA 2',3'-cyclic 3'-phosphodiesterase